MGDHMPSCDGSMNRNHAVRVEDYTEADEVLNAKRKAAAGALHDAWVAYHKAAQGMADCIAGRNDNFYPDAYLTGEEPPAYKRLSEAEMAVGQARAAFVSAASRYVHTYLHSHPVMDVAVALLDAKLIEKAA